MQTALQALRRGQSLTPDQQTTWRIWNADCKAAKWQQQLAETAPPPPPLEKNFPKRLPPPERQEVPEAPSTEVLPSGFVEADPQSTVEWALHRKCRLHKNVGFCTKSRETSL